ncbi:hypothetical protein IDJ75_01785 [Mucilaginibacter rigui]|uniref:Uncharacterized protein n=1 Tax=Mucilaginibacter rigui TaxID=534635 RepID=A0ABR7X092_9SPHI|nr:hypothetical protein [Mucilaginibacter rigui]MBD1383991.1 hypothetical protein [Mucilaginibacter rigui]
MKKLKYKTFGGWSMQESLCDFINDNNINQSDVLKIIYNSVGNLELFYYTVK